ncbi:MAG: serine/threonine-protein kinase [Gemmatimonadales bacterium]
MAELREQLQSRLSGSYTLGRELSGGGMSRVFVAEDSSLGRTVVIKVLAPELAAGLNAERFRREILLAAQLQHPHIVPVLAAGVADDLPYFVMPFVVGESLRNRLLPEAGLPLVETVSVLRDVAKALAFAHAQGVVHRDIKPDNVLLAGGSAVVTDFGIAKAISSAAVAAPGGTLTQVGTSLGTPAYMSPEQAAGDPDADSRSDFYSFGVMAYEMICGRTPFHDRATHSLIMAHIAELPEPIERLVPAVPPQLAHLVMRCLSKNPADRPASAKEILEDLDDIDLSGQRIRAGVPPSGAGLITAPIDPRVDTGPNAYADGTVLIDSPFIKPRRSKGFMIAVIAGVAAIVLALGAAFGKKLFDTSGTSALDDRSLAVVPFRVASADPSHHYLREGMLDLIAAKLSGEELRAIEPRTLLDAWRQAGGSENTDLSRDATLRLARQLKAGRALLGDVVGAPNRLVLTVSLLDVAKGNQLARVTVEGPPDSLASLVNQLATQLLTQTSGEAAARMTNLTSTSFPALRAFLDGQSRLRRGDAFHAAQDFEHALKEDSTFALAGLGLRLATSWYGDPVLGNRGLVVAWRERARLSPRDQALLLALAGPRFPQLSSNTEVFRAREQYLSMVPDNAEARYLVADQIFHYGSAMGIRDWEDQALAGFKQAMELDSTYLPGYTHAMPFAASMGDTAFLAKALRLRLAADTSSFWKKQHDWYMALRAGDTAQAKQIFANLGTNPEPLLNSIVRHMLFDGTGAADAKLAVDRFVSLAPTEANRRQRSRYAHDVMLDLGRPDDALQYVLASRDSVRDLNVVIVTLRDASLGLINEAAGSEAARMLAPNEAAPEPADTAARGVQRAVVRVMEPWRIAHGDTTQSRRSLQKLRSLTRTVAANDVIPAQLEIAFIEMLLAQAEKSPSLRERASRVDSLMLMQDISAASTTRYAQQTIVTARTWEKLRVNERALSAISRYAVWSNENAPFFGLQLREQGRMAALAGDRNRAVRAYRHYLAMHQVAEPSMKPQVDSVKRELARVEARR